LIHIDGSHGEGGGQILRSAVALSVLTKEPIEITDIRANRPNPGIKPQHYTAIKIIRQLCNAETVGLNIGSSRLIFSPGEPKGGEYKFDIGTAGSIVLVFQACLLSLVKTNDAITIRLTGGTDVKWSPSWDYFSHVFLPLIQKMGISVRAKLIRRGYYPKGGGEAILTIQSCKTIKPLLLDVQQNFSEVNGIVHLANLPEHVGKRMKHAAIKTLVQKNLKASLKVEKTTSFSAGTGITLWTQTNNTVLGKTGLGEKDIPAEKIGESVATAIIQEIVSGVTIDIHAFDQIIPYMALPDKKQSSCIVREISSHAQTNMWLVGQFFGSNNVFSVEDKKDLKMIKAEGRYSKE
jgi:RNA 3'-phosphate cyclase